MVSNKYKTKSKKKHNYLSKKSKKNKKHQTTRKKRQHVLGGDINSANIFQYIKSIGFEIETTELIKFTIENHDDREILVNSALTNVDLEYGYSDSTEYTYIVNTPEMQFKITNDSAEDSEFNEEMKELTHMHKEAENEDGDEDGDEDDEDDCKEVTFKLNIPQNEYLKQTEYDIMIREPDLELHNCSSFTDVEWITTFYKPEQSKNIILNTFFKSILLLKQHLSELKTIPNSIFNYLNEQNEYVAYDKTKINQTYVLPGTSLVYYNNSSYNIPNYNIMTDLKFVVQMTFSCNILYVFRLMKKLLSIEYSSKELGIVSNYVEKMGDNKSIQNINQMIQQMTKNESFDMDAIDNALEIVKQIFKSYNSNSENKEFLLPDNNEDVHKIKMYFFLIIYKLFIYLNSYVENSDTNENNLFKKNLSFAVRHNNYVLYLEMKKCIQKIFGGKVDNEKIIQIINSLVKNITSNRVTYNLIYKFKYIRDKKKELHKSIEENPEEREEHIGNPLLSITSYFSHFEKQEQEEDTRDWLVLNNIDEKSTKFELNDDTIIIEFRDFPSYCYLNLFLGGNDELRQEILKNNIGTLNMKIVDDYMKANN